MNFVLLITLFFAGMGTAFAEPPPSACNQAKLSHFYVKDQDLCATAMDAAALETLAQVKLLNEKAIAALGINPADFPKPLSLRISESPVGALSSRALGDEIEIGILPGTELSHLNAGIYLHEIGHVISLSENTRLPKYLQRSGSNPLLTEALADYLSINIEGVILSEDQNLPQCLDRTRYMTRAQSFNLDLGYFTETFSGMRILQCCTSLLRLNRLSGPWKDACEAQRASADNATLALDRRELSPETVTRNLKTIDGLKLDPHQLGLVLNSFVYAFAAQDQTKFVSSFKAILNTDDTLSAPLKCSIGTNRNLGVTRPRTTLEGILKGYRRALNPTARASFDTAWTRHGMDKLNFLEKQIRDMKAISSAMNELDHKARTLRNRCAGQLDLLPAGETQGGPCSVSCN